MARTVFVSKLTDGVLDPNKPMLGPVEDGGYIIANSAPGCWGPMMTPELKGCNEVTNPVYVEGAEVGDAIAIYVKSLEVTSQVSTSGADVPIEGKFIGDPYVVAYCPKCEEAYPESEVIGTGRESIRCKKCGGDIATFELTNGYTIAFNEDRDMGVTLTKEMSEKVAKDAAKYMAIPDESIQNASAVLSPSDINGSVARLRPLLGQLGTMPAIAVPDTHNSGDFGSFLIDAPHDYKITEEELRKYRTDAHMDCSRVREGSIVIAPVKVKGGGVYLGDVHAMQGDGEIGGHTTDVAAVTTLKVKVLKGLNLDGPIVLPLEEDLPHLAKPFTDLEMRKAERLSKSWGMNKLEKTAPIAFIGTAANLNLAIDVALERGATFLDIPLDEMKNRATIAGSVEICRAPGSVLVTILAPVDALEKAGVYETIKDHYNLKE